jgi:hypothetical protein
MNQNRNSKKAVPVPVNWNWISVFFSRNMPWEIGLTHLLTKGIKTVSLQTLYVYTAAVKPINSQQMAVLLSSDQIFTIKGFTYLVLISCKNKTG